MAAIFRFISADAPYRPPPRFHAAAVYSCLIRGRHIEEAASGLLRRMAIGERLPWRSFRYIATLAQNRRPGLKFHDAMIESTYAEEQAPPSGYQPSSPADA